MTATSGADQPTLRDQLVEALEDTATGIYMGPGWGLVIADALLPVIEADRKRAKAEAEARAKKAEAERDLIVELLGNPSGPVATALAAALRGKT